MHRSHNAGGPRISLLKARDLGGWQPLTVIQKHADLLRNSLHLVSTHAGTLLNEPNGHRTCKSPHFSLRLPHL